MPFDIIGDVHGHADTLDHLRQHYKGMTAAFLSEANDKQAGTPLYHAVNNTLNGKEENLPDGYSFLDKDGAEHTKCRIKWWQPLSNRNILKDVMVSCPKPLENKIMDPAKIYHSYNGPKPVFFGHYWLQGEPVIDNPHAICLDYSVAKGGNLVVCRLEENKEELRKQFVGQQVV